MKIVLQPGEKAPEFCLKGVDKNCEEKQVCLKDLLEKSKKGVVVYFYPRDNTPGCSTEAKDFTDLKKDFENLGYLIVGISPDSIKSHCNFIEKKSLDLLLLSDENKEVLKAYGAWGEKKMYGKTTEGVIRSTFVINKDGTILKAYYNVKAKGHAERVLNDLKQL